MTTFYLVRHGQTTGGPGDPGLAPSGLEQAAAAAEYLAARPIAAVYASPLRRAQETAAVIAAAAGTDVMTDARLRERANWGDVEGQSWVDFVAEWMRSDADRDYVIPGGLSANQAGARAAAFVRERQANAPDAGDVVAVAHGGIVIDLLLEFFAESTLLARNPDIRTKNPWGSISELRFDGTNATLGVLAHLPDG